MTLLFIGTHDEFPSSVFILDVVVHGHLPTDEITFGICDKWIGALLFMTRHGLGFLLSNSNLIAILL